MYHAARTHRLDVPYTPRFQPQYRYPIALPQPPRAGDGYWPGRLPPTIQSQPKVVKEVRFSVPTRSKTLPATTSQRSFPVPLPSPSRRPHVIAIAPLLAYNPHRVPHVHFNVEYSPAYARLHGQSVPLSAQHRHLLATTESIASMRIRCDALPWPIDVYEAAPAHGIRVGDVVDALSRGLWRRIRSEEFSRLDARSRGKLEAAFRGRVARAGRSARQVESEGIMRLDWVQGRSMFIGLVPTSEPKTWSVVFGPAA